MLITCIYFIKKAFVFMFWNIFGGSFGRIFSAPVSTHIAAIDPVLFSLCALSSLCTVGRRRRLYCAAPPRQGAIESIVVRGLGIIQCKMSPSFPIACFHVTVELHFAMWVRGKLKVETFFVTLGVITYELFFAISVDIKLRSTVKYGGRRRK